MDAGFQILPLRQHTLVAFHLRTRFSVFEVVALEPLNQVVEDNRVGSFGTVFGQDTYQQQVNDTGLVPLQGAQQRPPAKGQQLAVAGFAQR